jgi:hypothetical protein
LRLFPSIPFHTYSSISPKFLVGDRTAGFLPHARSSTVLAFGCEASAFSHTAANTLRLTHLAVSGHARGKPDDKPRRIG